MADQHIGYPGSVSAAQLASWIPNVGSARYSVEDVTHGRVVANAVGDRGVTVLPGTVYGDGIMDVFENGTNLNFAAASSERWDMVVLRRTWNPTPGASTSVYTIIQGGPNRSLPARQNSKGSVSDQPMALCRIPAGSAVVTDIVDLRCWADNGGMVAISDLVLQYQDQVGTTISIGTELWERTLTVPVGNALPVAYWHRIADAGTIQLYDWTDGVFGNASKTFPPQFKIQAGSQVLTTDSFGYGRITWPSKFPNGLLMCHLQNGDSWASGGGYPNVEGHGDFWGSSGGGGLTDVVFVFIGPGADGRMVMKPSTTCRINFIAIGW